MLPWSQVKTLFARQASGGGRDSPVVSDAFDLQTTTPVALSAPPTHTHYFIAIIIVKAGMEKEKGQPRVKLRTQRSD